MLSKKALLATVASLSGVTRLLEAWPQRPSLIVLNYHRIGDATQTPYDAATFSCTAEELDRQIVQVKKQFPVMSLDQSLPVIHGWRRLSETSILITFDDGYRDNFTDAFPVLLKNKVSATFFLPTQFIGTGLLPWWDVIAFIVKTTRKERIRLSYPEDHEFDVTPAARADSTRAILRLFKRADAQDTERFVSDLENACDAERPSANSAERCFMSWDEARRMQADGMFFGSHTHTHEVLSKLSPERQLEELYTSRKILEHELGRTVDTLAYPVGQPGTFTEDTFAALCKAGYSTAFGRGIGVNQPKQIDVFNVLRASVDQESPSLFRTRMALRRSFGRSAL